MTSAGGARALRALQRCFEGGVPAVIATAAADGTPNVTYLSRVHYVDDERVALSNQFFSKTSRNLAENPRASLLLTDPVSFDQYRFTLAYERTERRGPVFDRLRSDVDALAVLSGMQDVFKLRAADIYRVVHLEPMPTRARRPGAALDAPATDASDEPRLTALATLSARLSRCPNLDTLVAATVAGLAELFGYAHSLLLLLDEDGRRLYTIASRGYDAEGVGSEVPLGEGMIGMAAARCEPQRIGSVRWMGKYSQSVRRAYERSGDVAPGPDIPVPGLLDVQSRVVVPAMALGQLVGVLVVESPEIVAFTAGDEAVLTAVAAQVAAAVEAERTAAGRPAADAPAVPASPAVVPNAGAGSTSVRFYPVDGSTFIDGDYLIKGVAGRILWSLLGQHQREGRVDFTNREVRLDPSLELPAFRDNFENRLILLKRRLDERGAPVRIEKTGRGRFRLLVEGAIELETA